MFLGNKKCRIYAVLWRFANAYYTNEVRGIDRTKFACIDGTLYDEDPARPQGNMAYIQFWDKEDSTKLDAKKLMDMIK